MVMAHRPLHGGAIPPLLGRIAGRPRVAPSLVAWLAGNLLAERERWLLWLPVALGSGIALYFALPVEPPIWSGASALLLAALALCWTWWRSPSGAARGLAPALLGLLVLLLGFTVAT